MTRKTWTLRLANGHEDHFIDIRRKVGNRIVRAYLLDEMTARNAITRIKATLRGPKKEFKDFDKFLILSAQNSGKQYRILAEAKVYDNLRIVATDSETISESDPQEIISIFTGALQDPSGHNAMLIVSEDSVAIE
ncbi:hypothetical protein EU545_01390 [Candidatus Thorarchaeota archaeon]|nr:MAG: hypothetical protein EU545_01390 [Candidatus Thorarchaeota archaeon]